MGKPKILLVDDTRLMLELEKSFLKLSNVEVFTASNGVEALELVKKDPPDLIFMDMNMPAMDGISCCRLLKADPFLRAIPVVMLTTVGREDDRERAKEAGCDDYITKPIDRREFLEKARKYTAVVDRRELRVPCHFPVIFLLGKSPVAAHAMDIGDGGVFLSTREQLAPDKRLSLAFYLSSAADHPVLMQVEGQVAWLNEEENRVNTALPPGFGVEFMGLEEEETAVLKSFVDAERLRP